MLRFSELAMIWNGLRAQQEAEASLAGVLRALHPDNPAALTLLHPDLQAAHNLIIGKLLGSPEAVDWWEWWQFEVAGPVGMTGANVEVDGKRYRVETLEDFFALLVLMGHLPADPDFEHTLFPYAAA